MKTKKSRKADLESKRFIFTQTGMIIALALAFVAFEYKSYESRSLELPPSIYGDVIEGFEIPATKSPEPPPPPPAQKLTQIEDFEEADAVPDIDVYEDITEQLPEWVPPALPDPPIDDHLPPVSFTDVMPTFPGGDAALLAYINKNFVYPLFARENGITGIVYVKFIVETDGSLSDISLIRGIGYGCDEEALRVVSSMPNWNPGKQQGRPVRVIVNLPVRLVLR